MIGQEQKNNLARLNKNSVREKWEIIHKTMYHLNKIVEYHKNIRKLHRGHNGIKITLFSKKKIIKMNYEFKS